MSQPLIEVEDMSMMFNLCTEKIDTLKEHVIKRILGELRFQEFWVLQDINLTVEKGDSLGIVGLNGSGKSTLLKIIAGIMKPTKGRVRVHGTEAPLIELGAGFDADLTTRENVYLNGAVLGYRKTEIDRQFDDIIHFAELENFVSTPIKNLSSGMIARLGFSIATIRRPDILICDEILEVGDFKFRIKCEGRMREILSEGASIILVSHSTDQIVKMCNKVVWLEKGRIKAFGPAAEICEAYQAH